MIKRILSGFALFVIASGGVSAQGSLLDEIESDERLESSIKLDTDILPSSVETYLDVKSKDIYITSGGVNYDWREIFKVYSVRNRIATAVNEQYFGIVFTDDSDETYVAHFLLGANFETAVFNIRPLECDEILNGSFEWGEEGPDSTTGWGLLYQKDYHGPIRVNGPASTCWPESLETLPELMLRFVEYNRNARQLQPGYKHPFDD